MRRVLFEARNNREWIVAIAGLIVLAGAIGFYILRNEGLALPFDNTYTVNAQFSNAQALTPGQGEPVTVAGVKVGVITNVRLQNGIALVGMTMNRSLLPAVYSNATALIRPRTGLQDMTIDLNPGSAPAPKLGGPVVLPVSRTVPEINVDEVLALLDSDTRAWFQTLLSAGGQALGNRGVALRTVLKASAPTLTETRQVSEAIAARRVELKRAIGNLRLLTDALAQQQSSIGQFVDSGAAMFQTLGAQDRQLQAGLQQLPPTLAQADQTLTALRPFATAAAPAFTSLLPAAKRLPGTLQALDPLFRQGAPGAVGAGERKRRLASARDRAAADAEQPRCRDPVPDDELLRPALRRQRAPVRALAARALVPVLALVVRAQRELVPRQPGRQRCVLARRADRLVRHRARVAAGAAAAARLALDAAQPQALWEGAVTRWRPVAPLPRA
jgi:virulence factor Mce-like protein